MERGPYGAEFASGQVSDFPRRWLDRHSSRLLHVLASRAPAACLEKDESRDSGPFRADMKLTSADSVELILVDFHSPESVRHRSEERIATLLRNAVKCGESLLNAIGQLDWVNDKDAQALRIEIGAAKALLQSRKVGSVIEM